MKNNSTLEKTEKIKLQTEDYLNILGFLAPAFIEAIDNIEQKHPAYKHALKKRLNALRSELESLHNEQYWVYSSLDKETKDTLPKDEAPTLEIYFATAKAYDYAFEFFTQTPPWKVAPLMDILKKITQEDLSQYKMFINEVKR